MKLISISLLGPFEVRLDGEPVTKFAYAKVRALLAYLALESHHPHTRANLATLLWPDQPERAARASLSQALTTLRNTLGDKTSDQPVLVAEADTVQLDPGGRVEVDAAQFLALLRACDAHAHRSWRTCTPCAGRLKQALGLYRGNLLANFYIADSAVFEEWATLQREHLSQRALSVLERLAAWAEWRGRYDEAVEYARRQVELQPLLEANHRALMRLLALSGQRRAALAQYEALRHLLAEELGEQPDPDSVELHALIQLGAEAAGALRAVAAAPGRVPAPPTPLVGRAADVGRVCELLWSGARLVTLTGPPGIGKTRLALEAATQLRYDFEDGAQVVELAPLADPALVPTAIAHTLGVKEQAGQPLAAALRGALRDKHLLLMLDNFEHLLAANSHDESAAAFVAELLAACPAVQVLVTSRAPLHIRAEHLYPVGPLPEAESAALFVERARAARRDFTLTAEDTPVVSAICRRLDGLPLAIELIAVRARTLSLAELKRQGEQGLEALGHGLRDAPERHRTLRQAIAWSHERLSAAEQRAFAHLGVFTGGCTAEAAQAVLGAEGESALPALEALAEASLASVLPATGETRFGFLETIREFALEQLAGRAETEAARERHSRYFLELAERAVPELAGPEQTEWLDRLERDHDNLRAALAHSLGASDDSALRLAAALGKFWEVRGYLGEGRRWLAAALERSRDVELSLRARALDEASDLAYRQGDYAGANALNEETLAIWQRLEDGLAVMRTLRRMGTVAYDLADNPRARAFYEQSLALARELGDAAGIAAAQNNLALVAAEEGDLASARVLYEASLATFQALGDKGGAGMALNNLGLVAEREGDAATAEALLTAGLNTFEEIGHKWGMGLTRLNLGNLARSQGNLAAAQEHLKASLALYHELGDEATATYPLFGLGEVAYDQGDFAAARALFGESLAQRLASDEKRPIPRNLEGLGQVDRGEGRPERAARLFGAAEGLREARSVSLSPVYFAEHERETAALRDTLGEAALADLWAEGRALSLEEAVRLALSPG